MKRKNPKFRGSFSGGVGQGRKEKNSRGGGAPVVRWSHAEAMKKKKPSGGGDAVVAGGGGVDGSRGILGPGKAGLGVGGSLSCGSGGGLWTSWSEAAAPAAGKRAQVWDWPEPDAKRARPRGGDGEGDAAGGDDEEEVAAAYEWRWTEAVSPEILALVLRGRVAADDVARGAALVCRAWSQAVASPDMWGDVDIEAWCRRVNCRAKADAAVRRLVARAQGTLRRLSAYRVGDAALTYVAAS